MYNSHQYSLCNRLWNPCDTYQDAFTSGAKSGDRAHVFQTLNDTDTQVRSEFATALKKLSKVVSELCKQEKEVWVLSDELEEQCQAMTKRVDNTTQQLVRY